MMQMQREGSDMTLNGQRPRTPSADNAPSPSKRPRIDGGPVFNGQMMQNGRPGQVGPNPRMMANPNQARNMLTANGVQANLMSPAQVEAFSNQPTQVQEKSMQMFHANQGNGMGQQQMGGQGSPMMLGQDSMEIYAAARGNAQMGANGQNGNHALQDYQMQLMLLEQQNKKRLMMARQEQDNQTMRPDGQPMPGQPGAYPPGMSQGMSPQGSRAGPSPNPTDQMKRGTPKMGQVGLPNSPMGDVSMAQGRNSPSSMAFNMQNTDVFQANALGVGPNGPIHMRPPSSHPNFPNNTMQFQQHQMEAMRQQQQQNGARLQNPAAWQQGPPGQGAPMMQQPQPGQGQQPAPMGTPRQANQHTMGPPTQAPPAPNAADANRPRSPAPTNPPTPSQKKDTIAKGKKDGKDNAQRKVNLRSSVRRQTLHSDVESTQNQTKPEQAKNKRGRPKVKSEF